MANNVYNITAQLPAMAAGSFQDEIYECQDIGRSIQIKSILFDYNIYNSVSRTYYNAVNIPNDIRLYLEIGAFVSNAKVGKEMVKLSGLGTVVWNGARFFIWKAGQLLFNSFFLSERLGLRIYGTVANGSPNTYTVNYSLIVETTSEINY